ncbi:unnamed protein product [Caenorhabditis nigoni]
MIRTAITELKEKIHVEWDMALKETCDVEFPIICRRLFASILIHCAPSDPIKLWDNHWEALSRTGWIIQQRKAHVLRHIQWLLSRHGMTLENFELDKDYIDKDLPVGIDIDNIDNPTMVKRPRTKHEAEGAAKIRLQSTRSTRNLEDWRQILPIVEGVKRYGVTRYVLKNSYLLPDIEKFKLTENKRAESDHAYA